MEDEASAMEARHAHEIAENNSLLSSIKSPTSIRSNRSSGSKGSTKSKKKNGTKNGTPGKKMELEEMLDEAATEEELFTGHSCLLITWKTNPEVEQFKELYMENSVKTHKRKNKQLVDPGDLVSEKSLAKVYRILGKVRFQNLEQNNI